jgi:Uncharacterized protein conserved in bacteria (DUF2188)
MPVIEYFIVPEGANWAVRVDSDSTPYQTLAEAIEAAMEVARGARRCGFAAEVFVHRAQGGWESLLHLQGGSASCRANKGMDQPQRDLVDDYRLGLG